uniref:Homeobox domain-containing protein n=1 Tax=Paramormyrops kingsleyae TaxID=1676925 RepID=A0A3B3SY91_9TELE
MVRSEINVHPETKQEKAEPSPISPQGNRADQSRRHRTAFTREQILQLEGEYCKENYVSKSRRCELASVLNLPETTIKVWFQNRRMKDKRQRQTLSWPHPLDPSVYAYVMGQAALTLPHPLLPHVPLNLYQGLCGYAINHSSFRTLDPLQMTPSPYCRRELLGSFSQPTVYPQHIHDLLLPWKPNCIQVEAYISLPQTCQMRCNTPVVGEIPKAAALLRSVGRRLTLLIQNKPNKIYI